MADKQLTDSAWKAFAKGKGYKDVALLKALAAVDKADKGGPDAMLEALDDVDRQVTLLRKEHKGDKELGAYLDKLEAAATKEHKAAESAHGKAASESLDEEEDSPALLTTRLAPLLKQVRKGDVVLQALIATAGKETAVLLSRKSISPARGKLLKDYLGVSGGIKFIKGECLFEANAHTFVVMSEAAGLAKKLQVALLAQTGMRVKVRVRGEDPDDVDDDGGEEIADDDRAAPGDAPPAAPSPSATYIAQRARMQPLIDTGLAQPAVAAKVKALVDLAESKAAADNPLAALQTLSALEKLLASAPASPGAGGGDGRLESALEAWKGVRASVIDRCKEIAKDAAQDKAPEAPDVVREVMAVVKQLTADPRTAKQVQELIRWVEQDEVVADVSELDRDIQTPLLRALRQIETALETA